MSAIFSEVSGALPTALGSTFSEDGRVILSYLRMGAAEVRGQETGSLKYVATGLEIYRYGGKTYPLSAGQFMFVPELHHGDVEIGKGDNAATIGLCIYLPRRIPGQVARSRLDEPMIFSAACSHLGGLLTAAAGQMLRSRPQRGAIANDLIGRIANDLEPLLEETATILDGIEAQKQSTRYETLRRLNVARGYLHAVTDRQVELAELAKEAGISRFHLLRSFREAFGAPPASYHRKLRLELAKDLVDRQRLTCSEAAHRFGFADCSSFSHAYRRTFGRSPVRSLSATR